MMKKVLAIALLLFAQSIYAGSRDMIGLMPSDAMFVIGADFNALRKNELYVDLEKKGRIWSHDEDSELPQILKTLNIKPEEVDATLFVKYRNSYGSKGEIQLFQVMQDPSAGFQGKSVTPYLNEKLYRIYEDRDLYAVMIAPNTISIGQLTGVKMTVDLMKGKAQAAKQNPELLPLLDKIPANAGVWGIARPLTRRQAAAVKADQSTNAILEAFEHYYFFGVPSTSTVRSHFVGHAKGETEATFVRTFLIGTLTFAKFKSDNDGLSEALDQINVERSGREIHVSAVVNKNMVDAYLNGDLEME